MKFNPRKTLVATTFNTAVSDDEMSAEEEDPWENTMEERISTANQPVLQAFITNKLRYENKIPYGKFAGRPFVDVLEDKKYMRWVAEQHATTMAKYQNIIDTQPEKTLQEAQQLRQEGLSEFINSDAYRFNSFCYYANEYAKASKVDDVDKKEKRLFFIREKYDFKASVTKVAKQKAKNSRELLDLMFSTYRKYLKRVVNVFHHRQQAIAAYNDDDNGVDFYQQGKKKWFAALLAEVEELDIDNVTFFKDYLKKTLLVNGFSEDQISLVSQYHIPTKYYSINKKLGNVTKTYNKIFMYHMINLHAASQMQDEENEFVFDEATVKKEATRLHEEYDKMLEYQDKYYMMPMKIIKDYDVGAVALTEDDVDAYDIDMFKEHFNQIIVHIFGQMKKELNANCGKMKGAKTHIQNIATAVNAIARKIAQDKLHDVRLGKGVNIFIYLKNIDIDDVELQNHERHTIVIEDVLFPCVNNTVKKMRCLDADQQVQEMSISNILTSMVEYYGGDENKGEYTFSYNSISKIKLVNALYVNTVQVQIDQFDLSLLGLGTVSRIDEDKANVKYAMVLDVETTGLCQMSAVQGKKKKKYFKYQNIASYDDARVVQLSYGIVKITKSMNDGVSQEEITLVESSNSVIKPKDFRIPKVVSDIHGITDEKAGATGKDIMICIEQLEKQIEKYNIQLFVGQNVNFDRNVFCSELYRQGKKDLARTLYNMDYFCTCETSRLLLQLVQKFTEKGRTVMNTVIHFREIPRLSIKNPKLSELVEFLFCVEPEGLHDAEVDVNYTTQCYIALNKMLN